MKKRTIALVMAAVMLFGVAIGGTIAWLTAKTEKVVNTFTVGDIKITLTESENGDTNPNANSYKMVPGNKIKKDPYVKVQVGSEACWLFVKIEESDNLDKFIKYDVDSAWIPLENETGVYYREVPSLVDAKEHLSYHVIGNKGFNGDEKFKKNVVLVKTDVTKEDMNALTAETYPKLTFTAYAVQKANVNSAKAAWAILNP